MMHDADHSAGGVGDEAVLLRAYDEKEVVIAVGIFGHGLLAVPTGQQMVGSEVMASIGPRKQLIDFAV